MILLKREIVVTPRPRGIVAVALASALTILSCVEVVRAVAHDSTAVHDSVAAFVENRSAREWDQAVLAARTGRRDSKATAYSLVVDYYITAMKRDLPNSMAIVGSAPAEYVAGLGKQLDSLVGQIRRSDAAELWDLLQAMATQDADDTLIATSSEIAWRLSHDRFKVLAAEVAATTPSNSRVFQERREQLERESEGLDSAPRPKPPGETPDERS